MPTRIVGPSISIQWPVGRWPRSRVRRRGGGRPVNWGAGCKAGGGAGWGGGGRGGGGGGGGRRVNWGVGGRGGRGTGWTVAARVSRRGRGSWPLDETSIS